MRNSLAATFLSLSAAVPSAAFVVLPITPPRPSSGSSSIITRHSTSSSTVNILDLNSAFADCQKELTKTCKVKIAPVSTHRLGLVATQAIKLGESALQIPLDDRYVLSAELAKNVFTLPEQYDGWTGDAGLIALLLLNELAGGDLTSAGVKRDNKLETFMRAWVQSLPTVDEISHHPFFWSEDDQEVLQSSSTNKVYRRLDDLEEDATWLVENVFSKDRKQFPETVQVNGKTVDCYNVNGFRWAMANAISRSFFVDGSLRLIPVLDMCNHNDIGNEIQLGFMGTFGTTKGAELVAAAAYQAGDEICCSYGPKSAADYLLEHGFCPDQCWKMAVSEMAFELDPDDRFYDDKLDILEFETYDQAPMDPLQTFDLVSAPGRDGDPDAALIQFVRLSKLGGMDAFLLESIFRKDVWGFMELPVSEQNELDVINTITANCQAAIDEFDQCPKGGPEICTRLRESERKALASTVKYLQREREALDLKEYYQQRRLKDLGLDSPWAPEDDPELGYGQTRTPGGADYDW